MANQPAAAPSRLQRRSSGLADACGIPDEAVSRYRRTAVEWSGASQERTFVG